MSSINKVSVGGVDFDIGGTSLHLIGSQVGSGSKNVTVDTSKQKRLLAITKKNSVIVESKEIPVNVLESGDVIVLGDTAHVIYDSRDDDASYAPSVFPVSKAYNGKRAGLTQYAYYEGNYNSFATHPSSALAMDTTVYMSSSAELADTAKITFNGDNSFTITVTDSALSVYLYADMFILGGSANASDVSVDTTGTDLVSTDVQGIILELLEKIGGGGMPTLDYTNWLHIFTSSAPSDIPSGATYGLSFTANKDCYLFGEIDNGGSNIQYELKINNKSYARLFGNGNGGTGPIFINSVKLTSGDTVILSGACGDRLYVLDTK